MIEFEVSEIRNFTKMTAPAADFDSSFTFYYDETNNIKKFYVKENDFNSTFTANFVLGGLVIEGDVPDVLSLINSFKLQKNTKEVKFKHIAKGSFLDCLKSQKLTLFLDYLLKNNLYVHYSSLNILYWAIVDIVDSAVANSQAALKAGPQFIQHLKNDLYKLSRLEIDSVIDQFYHFKYPNIKKENIIPFIESLTSLFEPYLKVEEFHFGLESLRQILKESKKATSLPFIMDDEDYILLKDLSQFYLRPLYLFKNSTHIFDNEDSISETLQEYKILDKKEEINNYTFIDSESNQLIQLSDVFVGLIGKLSNYLNTNTIEEIRTGLNSLTEIQKKNIDLLIDNINKSHSKNIAFLHSTESFEEMNKMAEIIKSRKGIHT